jgi:hypothetical protein
MANIMKLFVKVLTLAVVLIAGTWITQQKVSAQGTAVSFQLFYDQLSPYGSWVDYQNYGYVWIPDVDRDFSPYGTNGHWVFTDDGWTWVSDYPWGWAPFHYGRWAYDDSFGWFWVPHNEWGPAWVTWRRSEGYYGWAPMGPGISLEVSLGGGYRVPNDRWIFVSDRDISRPDIDRHYVDRSTNITIINRSTVINNTYTDNSRHTKYVAGPARDDVQKVTGSTVKPVTIRDNDKPGQTLSNDQLQIYRPQVQASNNNAHRPVPSKLVSLKEVKPISGRTPGNQRQNANPPGNKAVGVQARVVNPPDKNKSIAKPAQLQTVKSSTKEAKNQQPRVVNPPGKNKGIAAPSQPQTVKPSVKKVRSQQPRAINTPVNNKGTGQQSKPRKVPSPNTKRQSPQTTTSPNKKGKVPDSQPPKPDKQKQDDPKPSEQ